MFAFVQSFVPSVSLLLTCSVLDITYSMFLVSGYWAINIIQEESVSFVLPDSVSPFLVFSTTHQFLTNIDFLFQEWFCFQHQNFGVAHTFDSYSNIRPMTTYV